MAWQDFLKKEETVALPWIGGSKITDGTRWFTLSKFPREHGWYNFRINGRKAEYINVAEPNNDCLKSCKSGYLIGNLILQDTAPSYIEPSKIFKFAEKVHFVPSSIDKFVRVKVGKVDESSEYIYISEDFPLGPEELVLSAYLDNLPIDNISGLPSSLVATYNYEVWYRNELERRRLDAIRRAEEAERERAERERKERLFNQLGTGSGRREMARVDFGEAAKAALAIGGAEYIDHRKSDNNYIVRFRLSNRRFECICNSSLSIIDAGICLTDSYSGEKGDDYFTLESLPMVIKQAIDLGVLHVFRHA
jgi:hypothetical protein